MWSCRARRDRRRRGAPARRARPPARGRRRSRSSAAAATRTRCCAWSTRAGPTSRSSTSACRRTHGDEGLVAAQEIRRAPPGRRRARPLPLPRVALRDAPARGGPGARRLPAQGARLGRRRAHRRAAPHRRGRVRDRPDDRRPADGAPARARPARRADRARARGARPDRRGPLQRGDRRAAVPQHKTVESHIPRSSSSSGCASRPRRTGACSPCSPTCVRAEPDQGQPR